MNTRRMFMKALFLLLVLSTTTLFAQKGAFSSQSDLTADLSDAVLNGIYHHSLDFDACGCERSLWLEGFGSYRERCSSGRRETYDLWWGGVLGGLNISTSESCYLNFVLGGSWGEIDIKDGLRSFDTDSILFGMTLESRSCRKFFGLAILGGVLTQERQLAVVNEKIEGVYFTPDLTYSFQCPCLFACPIITTNLRYAGFFARDYQHPESFSAVQIEHRRVQLITLRGEAAVSPCCLPLNTYVGVAGRFQVDGNRVDRSLLLNNQSVADGIDWGLAYGFIGLRGAHTYRCLDFQGNFEAGYDTDHSWRVLGELSLNLSY